MSTVVIHPDNGRVHEQALSERFPSATIIEPSDASAVPAALSETTEPCVLLTNNDSWEDQYLDSLDPGDWVATTATGYAIFPREKFESREVALTHMPTIYAEQVSLHAFAMAFAMARRLYEYHAVQQQREWDKMKPRMTDFAGDSCCIVGMGRIGETMAEQARTFGMTVRGVKRSVADYDGAADEVYPSDKIADAMDGARLSIIIVPLTDETTGLVGEPELSALHDEAIVVNVARGPVLQTDALVSALDGGEIRGACLDVFDEEPLPASSPLWERDDVTITPHMAGWSDKLPQRSLDQFCEQYKAWVQGEERPYRLV